MVIAIATIHGDTRYLGPILQTALDGLRPPADVKPAQDEAAVRGGGNTGPHV